MIQTLKKCIYFIESGKRMRWVLLIVLAVVVALLEAGGAALVYAILAAITQPGAQLSLPVVGDVHSLFPNVASSHLFAYMCLLVAVFFVVRGSAYLLLSYFQQRIPHNTGVRLSGRLLRGYLQAPYSFHLQRNSSELIRNMHESVTEVVGSILIPVIGAASELLLVLAILGVLLGEAPLVTLAIVAILGPMVVGIFYTLQPRLAELGASRQEMRATSIRWLQQSLEGIRDIKLLGRYPFFEKRFEHTRAVMSKAAYLRATFMDVPRVAMETVAIVLVLGFLAITIWRGESVTGTLSLLGLFAYSVLRMLPSVNRIVTHVNSMKFGTPAIDDLYQDLLMVESQGEERVETLAPLPFDDAIEIAGVEFAYPGAPVPALHEINVRIPRGESIGLVGPTGGGKSTLADVVLGLLQPTEGSVNVDGIDIRDKIDSWQLNLGVVSQTIFLFDGTLRQNIAMGLEDDEIDDGRLREAIRIAQLEDFIAQLPDGTESSVGERGVRLSGGERQRVAIARALYRQPNVLIFDEGTSALDSRTESEFIRALRTTGDGRTMITVAHRLTTIQGCDRVLIIAGGRIIDEGSFSELAGRRAEFRHAIDSQENAG